MNLRRVVLIDNIFFQNTCNMILQEERKRNQIGTLGEKTVHAVLKNYLEENKNLHERKIGSFYADIAIGDPVSHIIEIQTRNFNVLRKKLSYFLTIANVTIVYPIPHIKWLQWIDIDTGEISNRRKSPKRGNICMILPELYKIKDFLKHPNINLHIMLIDMEETRLLNGWSKDKKKGSSRYDRIPICLKEEYKIEAVTDYKSFIPDDLPEKFTSRDYEKVCKLSRSKAQTALNILNYMEVVERVEKKGNLYIYERKFWQF